MTAFKAVMWVLVLSCFTLSLASLERRMFISLVINQTFPDGLPTLPDIQPHVPHDRSFVKDICHSLPDNGDKVRIGCCSTRRMKHLYNVLMEGDAIVLFSGGLSNHSLPNMLPPITSYKMQREIKFNLPIKVRNEVFDPERHCKVYFPGTLHVVKRSTTHNIYHSVSDNFLVAATSMLLDAYLAPDMLHLPRQLLVDYNPTLFQKSGSGTSEIEGGAPHMRLLRDLMSDGPVALQEVSGRCYRRVIWGSEPHTNYLVALQTLRRKVVEFSRNLALALVRKSFTAPTPPAWTSANHFVVIDSPAERVLSRSKRPLKVALYTRGSSGSGRSIQNEQLLMQSLQAKGAAVFFCCDFSKVSLEEQLHVATQADVIMGLHGAALVHGIFMRAGAVSVEMKTLYAYESILFFVVADGRQGVHGQVDIRKYFTNAPGHRPIDSLLVDRMMVGLSAALEMQKSASCERSSQLKFQSAVFKGDFVAASQCSDPLFAHILGPHLNDSYQICENMLLTRIMTDKLDHTENKRLHCDACPRQT